MRKMLHAALMLSVFSAASSPVFAQYGRNDNPNLRNFYMARQQLQIMDDAPQVNDLRTSPAAAQAGAAPSRPQALPRAGFSTYMSGYAGGAAKSGLPEVNNGVPKLPPAGPNLTGQQASAGKLKAKAPAAPKAAPVAKAYKPYATTPTGGAAASGAGSSNWNTSTSVQGSVLHWNKRKSGY